MKILAKVSFLLMLASLFGGILVAQETQTKTAPGGMKMMKFSADNALIMGEIGAIITEEKGLVKVLMIPPKEQRPKEMQEVDLAIGDEVGMAAGKRIKSIKELKDAYTHATVGEVFKLGVRREGEARVVSFVKKDEKDMPKGQRMVIRQGGLGGDENSDFFPAFGIGIEKKGSDIVISETLPNAPKDLKKGDVVKTLNGKEIKSVADFNKEFDATKIGGTLTLELVRDGKQVVVSAPRPEPKGPVMMRRN
jgi:PDZ domain-containing secreted protein